MILNNQSIQCWIHSTWHTNIKALMCMTQSSTIYAISKYTWTYKPACKTNLHYTVYTNMNNCICSSCTPSISYTFTVIFQGNAGRARCSRQEQRICSNSIKLWLYRRTKSPKCKFSFMEHPNIFKHQPTLTISEAGKYSDCQFFWSTHCHWKAVLYMTGKVASMFYKNTYLKTVA